MSVEHSYVLTDSDYPTVPAKAGYSGAWNTYTEPVTQDITIEAVYTINQYTLKFVANGLTVKNMTVNHGYTLKTSDYPVVPVVSGKTGEWIRYTRPITRNITITARYSDAGINPPVKPPIETSSIDGAASNNGTVKETVTARHTYIYTGGQLAQETITTTVTPTDGTSTPTGDIMSSADSSATATLSGNVGSATTTENSTTTIETLYYAYDANGVPMSLTYTDTDGTTTTYYYATNIQGDVMAILDTTGTPVVEYTYDAWGNPLTTTGTMADALGELNSLRYRGYVYDTETELYYLSSRYYNPEIGRWINADNAISGTGGDILGYNMFAFCFNNPVNMSDPTGNWPKWIEKAAKVLSVVVAVTAAGVTVAAVSAFAAGTGSPAAVYGAGILLSAALSGINGGVANEAKGNSYVNGYAGGFISGGTQSAASRLPGGTVWGGALGTSAGTAVTMELNNLDPDSANSTASEIATEIKNSAIKATATSMITAFIGAGVGGIDYNTGTLYGGVADGCGGLMPSLTLGFGEGIKAFFGAADDALVYIWE